MARGALAFSGVQPATVTLTISLGWPMGWSFRTACAKYSRCSAAATPRQPGAIAHLRPEGFATGLRPGTARSGFWRPKPNSVRLNASSTPSLPGSGLPNRGAERRKKRWRTTAVQDASALTDASRTARSVLDCASPLALWGWAMPSRNFARHPGGAEIALAL